MLAALSGYGHASSVWTGDGAGLGLCSSSSAKHGRAIALHEDAQTGMAVAADIRLDNRRDLSDALGVPLPQREQLDDAALVLRAFQRWGRECPDRLFGDFAFAIFDPRKGELFCARDALGARPLYYALLGRRFVFGTSIESVLAAPAVPSDVDEVRIAESLMGSNVEDGTATFFKAVSKLQPGHSLTFTGGPGGSGGKCSLQRHWRPERVREVRPASDAAAVDELLELLGQAVRDRLVGEIVGVEVSGGLDSTALVALTVREMERQQRPPALGFSMLPAPDDTAWKKYPNEYRATTLVADHFAVPLHYEPFSAEQCVKDLRSDPLYPGTGYPRALTVAAELGVDVLLNGWGGDQGGISHNGFGYYHQLLVRGRLLRFLALARSRGRSPLREVARVALDIAHPRALDALRRLRHGSPPKAPAPAINRDFAGAVGVRARRPLKRHRTFGIRDVQLRSLRDASAALTTEHMAAQEASFGVRRFSPLRDRRVVEFGLGLPAEYYMRGSEERWLMRRAIERLIPAYGTLDAGKQDRARSDASFKQLLSAVPQMRRILEERTTCPAGAKYVDMPRLFKMLNEQWLRENRRQRHLLRGALSFLEF